MDDRPDPYGPSEDSGSIDSSESILRALQQGQTSTPRGNATRLRSVVDTSQESRGSSLLQYALPGARPALPGGPGERTGGGEPGKDAGRLRDGGAGKLLPGKAGSKGDDRKREEAGAGKDGAGEGKKGPSWGRKPASAGTDGAPGADATAETAKTGRWGRGKGRKKRSRKEKPPLVDSKGRRVIIRGKRPILRTLMALAVILVVGLSLYTYVIPRTDVTIRTIYHEAPGGGGTSGVMNLNVLVSNTGTLELENFTLTIEVTDREGEVVETEDQDGNVSGLYVFSRDIAPRDQQQPRVKFRGDQHSTYFFYIEVSFRSGDERFFEVLRYDTRGADMNQEHVERITQWMP